MRPAEPTDEVLIELFVRAERIAIRILGRNRGEDVAAEATMRAFSAWPRIADHPERWVARVAANLAIDELRKAATASRSRPERPDTGRFEDRISGRLDLVAVLERLPRRQREAVVLHHLVGLDEEQTATTMACPRTPSGRTWIAGCGPSGPRPSP
jgi:DNA-directed RNA polymerase specialized sigma24 family protein